MDIEQQILHTTLHIEGKKPDGSTFSATGFIFNFQTPKGNFLFLISNKHVLQADAQSLEVTGLLKAANGQPQYGKPAKFKLSCDRCGQYHIYGHADPMVDVAAIYIGDKVKNSSLFYRALSSENILPIDGRDTGLRRATFETVLFVGYPSGIYDEFNILPIARFGKVATQLDFDYLGKPQYLIDASVFGGSSGSPVFVYRKFQRHTDKGLTFGEEPFFAGVLAAVHSRNDRGNLVPANFVLEFKKELNLGLVFKATTVIDVVNEALKLSNHEEPTDEA
jgi:hypothetical protein